MDKNKYSENIRKLISEKIKFKSDLFRKQLESRREREKQHQEDLMGELRDYSPRDIKKALDWSKENSVFSEDKFLLIEDTFKILNSASSEEISIDTAEFCLHFLQEYAEQNDILERILAYGHENLQKALDFALKTKILKSDIADFHQGQRSEYGSEKTFQNMKARVKKEYLEEIKQINIIKETILKLKKNQALEYIEMKLSYSILNELEKQNEPQENFNYSYAPSIEMEEKWAINSIDEIIKNLENLLIFSNTLDDNKIVSYVDGHLDITEGKKIEELIAIDDNLKEEVNLLKQSNSYFGMIENDFKELNPAILDEWLKVENTLKKNNLNPARVKTKTLISKIKDFFTFKPLDFGFAAFAPVFIGASLLYGTNGVMMASNPALIQLSQLSSSNSENYLESVTNSFPGSNIMPSRGDANMTFLRIIKEFPDCSLPNIKLDKKLFNRQFQIKVTNPNTKKSFKFLNNDKLLAGNKIEFYFDYNKKGTVYIDNVISSKKVSTALKKNEIVPCKTENFLTIDYKVNTRTKIGETFYINPPWGKERIIVFFKDERSETKHPIGILNYQPTTLENFDSKFINLKWKKQKNAQNLERNGLYRLYSDVFQKRLYAPNIKSWKNKDNDLNNKNNIYIDFDGDDKAEIIAINDEEKSIQYYVFDTNKDSKGDILVYPRIEENLISYEWLIDTNYDGFIDQMGYDQNGDWKIEKTKDM